MKKAGVDFGLSNVKIFWVDDRGLDCYLSTPRVSRAGLVSVLCHLGIKHLCVAGNGPRDGFEGFHQHAWPDDPIRAELRLQANGARHLMLCAARPLETKHIVVGIGTGMSITVVNGEGFDFPVGSAYGAGSIDGLLALLGLESGAAIDRLLEEKEEIPSFDLSLGEAAPALKGTPYEHWIAASFVNAARGPREEPALRAVRGAKSIIQHLATDLASRLLLFERIPEFRGAREVVIVGMMPHTSRFIRKTLEATLRKIGKTPIFPPRADYALAVGCYHMIQP